MKRIIITMLAMVLATPALADVCISWDRFVPPHKMKEVKKDNYWAVIYRQENWDKHNKEWADATDYNDPIGSLNRRARLGDNIARKYLADNNIKNDYDWCAWAKLNKGSKLFW